MAIDLSKNGWYIEYEYTSLMTFNQYKTALYGGIFYISENNQLTPEDILAIRQLCLIQATALNIVPPGWLATSGFSLKLFQPLSILLPETEPTPTP